jgi:DNA-binding protein H-NS
MPTLADIQSQIQKHNEQIAQLGKQAQALREQERGNVIADVRKKIEEYGLTAADLKLGGRGASKRKAATQGKAPAKYRGPNGESWSGGRGPKPHWVKEALAAGKSLSDFAI